MRSRLVRALVAASAAIGTMAVMSSVEVAGQAVTGAQTQPRAATLPNADVVKAFIAARMARDWAPPKTPWGDPDVQGVFTSKDEANTPFERPDEWAGRRMEDITPQEFAAAVARRQQDAVERAPFAGGGEPEEGVAIAVPIHWFDNLAAKNSRPWFVIDPPDGKVPPMTAEAQPQARAANAPRPRGGRNATYLDRSLGDRCIAFGVWRTSGIYGNSFQILQTPDYVVLRYEMIHEARVIPLDGRRHTSPQIGRDTGDARGHWEGNTLVVETRNISERMNYRGASAKNQRLVERFTRIAPNKVEWTVTIDDPTSWTRPWTYSMPMTEDDTQLIHEYACHEGNYAMANILTAGRTAETKAADAGR